MLKLWATLKKAGKYTQYPRAVLIGLVIFVMLLQVNGLAVNAQVADYFANLLRSDAIVPPLEQDKAPVSQPAADMDAQGENPILASATMSSDAHKPESSYEDKSKRTEHTSTIIQADGKRTQKISLGEPMHYKKNGVWSDLAPTASRSGSTVTLSVGDISMSAKPLQKGIDYDYKGKKFSAVIEGARNVEPQLVKEDGKDVLRYDDAFDGIDITYAISGYSIKESIIVKSKVAQPNFKFTYKGISLLEHKSVKGAVAISGLPDDELILAPLNVMTSKQLVSDPVVSQKISSTALQVTLDKQWLDGLADDSLPVVIDPTMKTISKTATDMQAIRSDGYRCGIGVCSPQAGNEEYPGFWAYWRTLLRIPFDEVNNDAAGAGISSARLHFVRNGGITGTEGYTINPAGCWDFNCAIEDVGTSSYADVGDDTWMDVTNTIDWMYWAGMTGDPIILRSPGEALQYRNIKSFDLSQMVLEISYFAVAVPPQPELVYPVDKKVISNQQPILRVNPVTSPDGQPVKYVFFLMSSPTDIISSVVTSDTHWAVPEGLLKDGVTYYWSANSVYGQSSQLGAVRSFKVDLRRGKDSTQSYDTVGPVSIDEATGNLSTSVSSHKLKALGGDIGVSLDYNTPAMSRPGLVAEYWNNDTLSGSPQLTTTVPNIDFNWGAASPMTYEQNPSGDTFSARYSGYVSVPTTGSYTFGAQYDDGARIYINGTLVLDAWTGVPGSTTYGTAITLTAGSPVSIKVEYHEGTGSAGIHLLAKTPANQTGALADLSWFETGVKALNNNSLTADYYRATDANGTFPTTPIVSGEESSFNYESSGGLSAKVPGGTVTPDLVRYKGTIKAPTTGLYTFSIDHAGGLRVKVNGQLVITNWDKAAMHSDSSQFNLTAGSATPIEIEYWDPLTTPARLKVYVQGPSVVRQILPTQWLASTQSVLPSGWQLGVDGNGAAFDRLRINGTSVILTDSTGSTHEYKWQSGAFVPPANEYGVLTRNSDGTHTFKDEAGKEYLFGLDGSLSSMSAPTDDKKPAGLKYVYSGSPSRLTRITDSVNTTRYADLLYAGINAGTNCTPPTGFDAAPTGYLCKVKTTDGTETNFIYKSGNLARVAGAGNQMTDYGYDSLKRLVSVRDPLANDAIAAGINLATDPITYNIAYDGLGKAKQVIFPAATTGAVRATHNYVFLAGATLLRRAGLSEPSGYSQRTEYDDAYRTTQVFGLDGKATKTQWDAAKDLVLSTTDPLDLKTTTIYDAEDRPVTKYGPAPSAWFGTNNIPVSTQLANVPKTDTKYDEAMQGLSASYYDNKQLAREPKGRSFERGNLMRQWTSTNRPVTPTVDGWGVRMTGELVLPVTGDYTIKLTSDDGVRAYIDNKLYIDDWTDGVVRDHPVVTYSNDLAGKRVNFRIDYYDKDQADVNSKLELRIYKPGATETDAVQTAGFLAPNFSLTTSETVTDSTMGQITNTRTYNRPEYGMLDKVTLDPSGLNYASTTTTETPGSGFFRQLSKTLPGGNKTTYQYYTSSETRDDPCTTAIIEAAPQAGLPKGKTEPDPDGAGAQISQTSEMVYDQSGQVVAARLNNESWTCTTYDARGRVTKVVTPASGSRPGMTSDTNYAVGGNPLIIASTDSNGSVTTQYDLLGRVVKYTDATGSVTTFAYDIYGRVSSKTNTQLGTEVFAYDSLDRLTSYTVNGVLMANVFYDTYSRVKNIDYPASNIKLVSLEYDSLLRIKAANWTLSDGTSIREDQTKSTTGLILSNNRTIGTAVLNQKYTYDKAGRLRTANVGTHTMSYGFEAPSTTCPTTRNGNAPKNANRSSQTIDGVTTTYCYDFADRLLTSSDANYNNPVYDDRGNITQIGSNGKPIKFSYDQANRAIRIEQSDASGNGTITEFIRDAGGRVLQRKQSKLTNGVASVVSQVKYIYSTSGDSADVVTDMAGTVIRKAYSLPGGITLTSSPTETLQSNQRAYAIPNFHGDTMLTTDYSGLKTGVFTYDPFGNQLDSTTPPQNTAASGTTKGYLGQFNRLTETDYSVPVITMGDRVYLPGLGRFMQPDPVEGGNASAYIYPADPVNGRDTDGNFAFLAPLAWFVVEAVVTAVVLWVIGKAIDKVAPPPYREPAKTAINIASFAVPGRAASGAVAKAPVYVPKATKLLKDVFGGNTYVYKGFNKAGKDVYVGITNNIAKRQYQHGERFQIVPLNDNPVTRMQARSIEESLIMRNPQYQNKIHSISPKNVNYNGYLEWGNKWLDQNGVR